MMRCSVLMEHFEELLPMVSIPTVREACQKYGLMFKSLPRGLFVTLEDRGRVFRYGLGPRLQRSRGLALQQCIWRYSSVF